MATTVLDAYSKAYPSITNRIRASVYLESDLLAPVATIIDVTAGHPARIWHFPGLTRANYQFSLDEIDGGGSPINNLALFDVVPGAIESLLVRDDEQIKVGTTTGFNTGLQVVVFDGAGGKPNYIGYEIVPSELTGRGILVEGLDYSWNKDTATFTLLQAGDVLQANNWYNIHFNPTASTTAGGSVPTITDFSTRIINVDESILIEDFGNNIIVEPSGVYIVLTLPDITTVAQGRILRIETAASRGTAVQCVRILPNGSDTINFLRGNLFMMNNESIEIYRFNRSESVDEWRVRAADGNFKKVGECVGDDAITSGVYCKQLLDGSSKSRYQFSRIYEEVVLTLPGTQVVNYDSWATGNNKYLFSLANSSDPGNADKFHFPDRRGLFERNNLSGKSGDYLSDLMKTFWTVSAGIPTILQVDGTKTEVSTDPGPSPNIQANVLIDTTLFGSEVRPKNYLINKYILL